MIKHVYQRQSKGCGIACIAMLCGLRYWDVYNGMSKAYRDRTHELAKNYGLTRKELCEVLKHAIRFNSVPLNITIEYLCPRPNFHLESGTIGIAKMPLHHSRNWHWVVWDGRMVYDPALPFGIVPYQYVLDQGARITSLIPMHYHKV